MNAARRAEILKIASVLEGVRTEIENVQSEEQDYYDNMPDSFQNGGKGESAQYAIDALQNAADNIDSALSELETAVE